jgi:hypothetical protein
VSPCTAPDRVVFANQLTGFFVCFPGHKPASRRVFRSKATLRSYSFEARNSPGVTWAAGYADELVSYGLDGEASEGSPISYSRDSRNSAAQVRFGISGEAALDEAELSRNEPRRDPFLEGDSTDSTGDQQKLAAPNRGLP